MPPVGGVSWQLSYYTCSIVDAASGHASRQQASADHEQRNTSRLQWHPVQSCKLLYQDVDAFVQVKCHPIATLQL